MMQRSSFCACFSPAACRTRDGFCRVTVLLWMAALAIGLTLPLRADPPARKKVRPSAPSAPVEKPDKPAKQPSGGIYTDRSGTAHHWQILETKALIWDGKAYLPVGGTFAPRSFLSDGDAAWQEDVTALSTLKSKGLLDVIVWPGKPLPDVPAASFQRLLDYLDANGFRYGLAFGPGLTAPLTGTIVKPAAYRFADKDSVTATWQVPDADSGLVIQTDPDEDNKLLQNHSGPVDVRDGLISVPIEAPDATSKIVTILYPHKALPLTGDSVLPDLWAGFDDYRDRLLAYFGQVKFGSGLRFFLDPLARHIGLLNETDYLVPDSTNFLLEWEGYLARKYPNVEEAKNAWSLNETDFKTHQELARLIPLWANGRGVPYFYDPVAHKYFRVTLDVQQSRWWQDFLQYRNDSILYYMNSLANILKRQVADVPVVVTWTQSHPIFRNTDPAGGFDGLGIVARGPSLVARAAGPAYSEAEQSAHTIWCVATEVVGAPDSGAGGARPKTAALQNEASSANGGYASQRRLVQDLESLRAAGIKGFFAGGFQTNPDDTVSGATDWLRSPEALDWLHDYAGRFDQGMAEARYAPQILFFPQNAPGPARIGPVPGESNVLWLDSFYPGETQDWWPAYSGYNIQTQDGEIETVLVSLQPRPDGHGMARETHLWVPNAKQVTAARPDGTPVPVKIASRTEVLVTLDETPTIIRGGGQHPIPQEAASDAMIQLGALIAYAQTQKVPMATGEELSMQRAVDGYHMKDYDAAYTFARSALDQLTLAAKPYIWLEGEDTRYQTFTEVAPNAAASSGAYLRLSTPNAPGRIPYGAFYLFDVPTETKYNIWLAGTPPGPGISPIRWRINQDPPQEPADPTPKGPLYLNDHFGWFLLGTATLKKGDMQRLTIYVTDRAASPPNYVFSIDSILLIPANQPFTPNGRVRPLPVDAPAVRAAMRDKRLYKR